MLPYKIGCTDDPSARIVRIVHISDTHGCHEQISVPDGDILVHSGDFFCWNESCGFVEDAAKLDEFFAKQPHKAKIFVAGNHEVSFCCYSAEKIQTHLPNVTYLQDTSVLVDDLLIHGSPWTGHCLSPATAFTLPSEELYSMWSLIPRETKLLVTHSPPHSILDLDGELGCRHLKETVEEVRPLVHLFGHAHLPACAFQEEGILFSNGSQGKQAFGKSKPVIIDVYLPAAAVRLSSCQDNLLNLSAHKVGCIDNPDARVLRVVHISDTHGCHEIITIPDGDILVHSGDFFCWDESWDFDADVAELDQFFAKQPHRVKIFVAGNHELSFHGHAAEEIQSFLPNVTYLQDDSVTVEGLLIYGSPWTGWRRSPATAFTAPYEKLYSKYWSLIPQETKLLVTHSPPHGILDNRDTMGCKSLKEVVKEVRPLAHLFGHAHHKAQVLEEEGILFSNGSQGQHAFGKSKPVVIDVYLPKEDIDL